MPACVARISPSCVALARPIGVKQSQAVLRIPFLRETDRDCRRRGATVWPDPPTPAPRARWNESGSRDLHSGGSQGTHPVRSA